MGSNPIRATRDFVFCVAASDESRAQGWSIRGIGRRDTSACWLAGHSGTVAVTYRLHDSPMRQRLTLRAGSQRSEAGPWPFRRTGSSSARATWRSRRSSPRRRPVHATAKPSAQHSFWD